LGVQKISDVFNFGQNSCPKILTSEIFGANYERQEKKDPK